MREREISVPIIIANTNPFYLIQRDENDSWNATLDDINKNSYDYVKLHRLTNFLDVGLPQPFNMAIGYDGSLILPALPELREKEKALLVFNQIIGEILFGGIYFEAVQPRDLSFGELYTIGYFKQFPMKNGLNANFHHAIGDKKASILERINLLNPKTLQFSKLLSAVIDGRNILKPLPNLSISLVVNGITYLINNQWAEALSNIWTSIEQIINTIWENEIINNDNSIKEIQGRRKFLEDYRTWITSSRIELLYQKQFVDKQTYIQLNFARKARNEFIHKGTLPSKKQINNAIEAMFSLISLTNTNYKNRLLLSKTLTQIKKFDIFENHHKKKVFSNDEVVCWMPIEPIPGDSDWGDKPFELIEGIQLKPISK